jgi:hypothetical protein
VTGRAEIDVVSPQDAASEGLGSSDIPRRTAEVRKVRRAATGTCCREARVKRERFVLC